MKKVLCIALVFIFALFSAAAETEVAAPAPGELLGFELLKEFYQEGENALISPASLALALGMAAEGAQGDTLGQILDALGAESTDALSAAPEGIVSANAAFVQPGLELKDAYIAALNEKYGAEWFEIDGGIVEDVNAWVEEHTDGMIDSLLSQAPDDQIAMLLVNAVAMDAEWELPFHPAGTQQETFHAAGGDVTVDMMHQTEYFDYAEKDGHQMIRLPYVQGDLAMYIVLPQEGGMQDLLDRLAQEGMQYLAGDLKEREVVLSLPRLDISAELSMAEALRKLGMDLPFDRAADFSGISDLPLCIDQILQKTRLKLDEAGTEASAATMVSIMAMALFNPEPPAEMRMDRPFLFAVADAESGALCFAGIAANPG